MKREIITSSIIFAICFTHFGCSNNGGNKETEPATVNPDFYELAQNGSDSEFLGLTDAGKEQENLVIPAGVIISGKIDGNVKNVSFESDDDIELFNLFTGCNTLETVKLPSNISSLSPNAFANCSALKEIVLPKSISVIPSFCFSGDSDLENVTIEGDVTDIGTMAFRMCTSLKSINLPDSITSLGDQAFSGCCSIKVVTLPKNLKNIGSSAFYNDTDGIETFIVPAEMELESWDSGAFIQSRVYTVKVTKDSWADIHFDEVFHGQVQKDYI